MSEKIVKGRDWAFIVYPESAPKNWREILDETHMRWVESPLHDKDFNPDGTFKKPHWHVMLSADGPITLKAVEKIIEPLNVPAPQKVGSGRGMIRYFIHLDNPEKYQYSRDEIVAHGGADVERSYLNYDLVNRTENYKRDIEQFINDNKSSSRAVRKDAVLINEWIITSDNQFFKDKDDKEIKDFFEQSKDYFAEKFGDENIRYAQVHLDETTPHMHLGIVPFNAEKKLSAKTVFNRQALQAVQDELPKYLNERGFELERGEKGSERKNLTVPEYKKAKDELKEMTTTLEQRKSEVLALSNDKTPTINKESLDLKDETKTVKVPSGETIGIGKLRHEFTKNEERKTGNVIIPESKLNALIQGYEDLYKSNEQLKKYAETDLPKRIDYVKGKYKEVVRDYNDLADRFNNNLEKIDSLEKENKSLKNEIKGIYRGFNQFMENTLGATVRQAEKLMNNLVSEIKEFVKGGEFEKIHRNETRTRDRDELSR
ncbi:MobV family relaxase [Lactobacillus johnsonii]|uniref:MobV family relaxase n=3 Tax=Bacilli TaxID=91061 RepID=UPI001CC04046|nr:MobV family relaxase [Lactobacillus johnsonii]MBZ4027453.1 plasmid recombination protein [Lactobacillus johnsonii]